jgi:hypothetical protein
VERRVDWILATRSTGGKGEALREGEGLEDELGDLAEAGSAEGS